MKLSNIVSMFLGLLLIFIAPYGNGYFKDWLIPIASDYRISLFEAFVLLVVYFGLTCYGFKARKYEKLLLFSLVFTIFIRFISILVAENIVMSQFFSVFRYFEALSVIYILANLFSNSKNRNYFIKGLIFGVAIETIGGILVFLSSHYKGVFISNSSFILQNFLVIVCLLILVTRKRAFSTAIYILLLVLSIFATMTRTAWIFLLVSIFVFGLVYFKKQVIKNILLLIALTGIFIVLIGFIAPSSAAIFDERISSAFSSGGSVTYRLYLWDKSFSAFLAHPILGIGSGNFSRHQADLPQIFNVELPSYYSALDLQLSTHNTFLGVLAETGVLGLAGYVLWIFALINICRRVFKSSNINLIGDRHAIAAALILLSGIISDFMTQFSFTPIANVFTGFVLGWLREKKANIIKR